MKKLILLLTVVSAILTSGCGSKEPNSVVFLREELDLNYIERVAILPFDNLTNAEYAGERLRSIAITETLATGKFDVIEEGVVDAVLREMALGKDAPLDAPVVKILGRRLGVNAFITGTVNNMTGGGGGAGYSYAEVSLTLHLIDAETAQILWRSTAYKNGYSVWNRLFDLDPRDEFEITTLLLKEMLETVPR